MTTEPRKRRPQKHARYCGARTKNRQGRCRLKAGFGTNHPGVGRCKFHGGCVPNHEVHAQRLAEDIAYRSGDDRSYAELVQEKPIAELFSILKRRGDVTDLTEDISLARAILVDFINRSRALENALLRWSQSWDPDWQATVLEMVEQLREAQASEDWDAYGLILRRMPDPLRFMQRPRKVVDVSDAIRMLKDISSIAGTISAMENASSIPVQDVEVLLVEVAGVTERAIRSHLSDPATRRHLLEALQAAYAEIRIEPWSAHGDGAEQDRQLPN